ncbi:hypothetical protein [Phenylobacterium sp.]|uniref:hypothetical protein n=1 Tax=Phenylobacterium sp. TaxID=1871053 RepID=UPI00271C32A0|nr:hypothetical protein [Phenylobacterium sp.]MDO8377697.1 hypothetical protein [Phenylobacterium sp.]
MTLPRRAALAAALALAAAPALAQPSPAIVRQAPATRIAPQIVRGVVKVAKVDALVLKTREGKEVTVNLAPTWTVSVMKPITVAAIQPGSFIGTAEMPQKDGRGKSLEVHIFPPGVKMGEGHYAWDLKKGSMMTNGTVGKVVASKNGQELDVTYSYGTRHIVVPKNVPIVQITPGERAMIKPGVSVFLVAQPSAKGLTTNAISTGEKGKAPPM